MTSADSNNWRTPSPPPTALTRALLEYRKMREVIGSTKLSSSQKYEISCALLFSISRHEIDIERITA